MSADLSGRFSVKLNEAEKLHNEALASAKNSLGEDDPTCSQNSVHLGRIALARGDHLKAELPMRKALQLRRGRLGENHPWTVKLKREVQSMQHR